MKVGGSLPIVLFPYRQETVPPHCHAPPAFIHVHLFEKRLSGKKHKQRTV